MGYMTFCKAQTPSEFANFDSHRITVIDDCYRCMFCEIGAWNAHKEACNA